MLSSSTTTQIKEPFSHSIAIRVVFIYALTYCYDTPQRTWRCFSIQPFPLSHSTWLIRVFVFCFFYDFAFSQPPRFFTSSAFFSLIPCLPSLAHRHLFPVSPPLQWVTNPNTVNCLLIPNSVALLAQNSFEWNQKLLSEVRGEHSTCHLCLDLQKYWMSGTHAEHQNSIDGTLSLLPVVLYLRCLVYQPVRVWRLVSRGLLNTPIKPFACTQNVVSWKIHDFHGKLVHIFKSFIIFFVEHSMFALNSSAQSQYPYSFSASSSPAIPNKRMSWKAFTGSSGATVGKKVKKYRKKRLVWTNKTYSISTMIYRFQSIEWEMRRPLWEDHGQLSDLPSIYQVVHFRLVTAIFMA